MADKAKPYRVMVTTGNLYLPLDEGGNCLAWQDPELPTTKLVKGSVLLMHPELAKSLDAAEKVKLVMD